MAGVKVTDLLTLGSAASDDVMYIVETSTNTSKQIEVGNVVNLQTAYDNGSTINRSNVIIEDSTGANIVAIGELAADSNTGTDIVAIGSQAGSGNTGSSVVAIGNKAALNNTGSAVLTIAGLQNNTGNDVISIGGGNVNSGDTCLFLGRNAGNGNAGNECVFLGEEAGANNVGNDVIALGWRAAESNSLSGMFVISQNSMPSYADATAAAAAITVALGARPADYYLYHDQSDGTIKAIIPV